MICTYFLVTLDANRSPHFATVLANDRFGESIRAKLFPIKDDWFII